MSNSLRLITDNGRLSLTDDNTPHLLPLTVDFASAKLRHRLHANQKETLVKATGIGKAHIHTVVDCNAGLGVDSFILAANGADVAMLERHPIVYQLLNDGLLRAQHEPSLQAIVKQMQLLHVDANQWLTENRNTIDVVYLDPMFPLRKKSAAVKKEMQIFHQLVGQDHDADSLLSNALKAAKHRVVVKRPKSAPYLAMHTPHHSMQGKSCRFDMYSV